MVKATRIKNIRSLVIDVAGAEEKDFKELIDFLKSNLWDYAEWD